MSNSISRRGFIAAAGAASAAQAASALAQASGTLAPTGDFYVNSQKVFLAENTRQEIREALAGGRLKAAILPAGSVEQHNEHLALVCDIAMSTLVSQQVALQLYPQVTVAPPCPLGWAPYHMARKGTLTIRKETLQAYVFDVLKSLRAHGIRIVLILNGHSGNHEILQQSLPGWRKELGITLDADSYWRGIEEVEMKKWLTSRAGVSHAAEFETSLLLAAFPERVRRFTMQEYDAAAARWNFEGDFPPEVAEYLKPFTPKGEHGRDRARQEQALLASAEKGQELIAAATRFFVRRMNKMIETHRAGKPWPPAKT